MSEPLPNDGRSGTYSQLHSVSAARPVLADVHPSCLFAVDLKDGSARACGEEL